VGKAESIRRAPGPHRLRPGLPSAYSCYTFLSQSSAVSVDSLIKAGSPREPSQPHRQRPHDRTLKREMSHTPFPGSPAQVAPLSSYEFESDSWMGDAPSIDVVCSRFTDDLNRALVWILRYRALTALVGRAEIAAWFDRGARSWRDMFEVAAEFPLNSDWGFDDEMFCAAVDATASRRSGSRSGN